MPPTPDFLIIGAQKCGTTWLHQHLSKHPAVFMPAQKELEFFSYQGHLENPGFARYLENFSSAAAGQTIGEATASYFWTRTNSGWGELPGGFQTNIPQTVHDYLGNELKLIVTLRNPVKRAVSAYLHYLAMGEISADTDFTRAMKYGGVVDMGFYARHLRNWLEFYPLDQIKVIDLEADIQLRPIETLHSVCRFLGVNQHHQDQHHQDQHHDRHDFGSEAVQKTVFAGTQRSTNENGVFVSDAGGQHSRQVISGGELQQLNKIFHADVEDLDSLLGTRLVKSWGMHQ